MFKNFSFVQQLFSQKYISKTFHLFKNLYEIYLCIVNDNDKHGCNGRVSSCYTHS